ncbi:MAG: serine hydrolase [Anaerolineaceae bacterium]|nr:serine hydrolase [Anaerolineaceae bacterium]
MHIPPERIKKLISSTAVVIIILFGLGLMTSGGSVIYMVRLVVWGRTDTGDAARFAVRSILNRAPVSTFRSSDTPVTFEPISHTWQGESYSSMLDELMTSSNTTALIILQDGTLQHEHYYNGASQSTLIPAFSVVQSFNSALIGIAIAEGFIESVDDPIVEYLPELDGRGLEGVTIRHLLNMSTGIRYFNEEAISPFIWMSDDARTYYMPDLRELALKVVPSAEQPGEKFHYNNYHSLLEGMILERTTGVTVSYYLQEKLWKPLGMQYPATWSVDSKLNAFEKMTSGLNARSIDFARFGQLMLENGDWQGRQLIPESWVRESTRPDAKDERAWMDFTDFKEAGGYYKYHWWGIRRPDGHYVFFAKGSHGQYIYICPKYRIVIVRNGNSEGQVDDWLDVFQQIEDQLVANLD